MEGGSINQADSLDRFKKIHTQLCKATGHLYEDGTVRTGNVVYQAPTHKTDSTVACDTAVSSIGSGPKEGGRLFATALL